MANMKKKFNSAALRLPWGSFDCILYKPVKIENIKKAVQFLIATR